MPTPTVPYDEPKIITIGERVHFRKKFTEFYASEYTLVYYFRGRTGTGFNATATAYQTTEYDIDIPTTDTDDMSNEVYVWQSWLEEIADATNRFQHQTGEVYAAYGFSSAPTTGVDLRSDAEKSLDALNAVMLGKASMDQLEYTIGNRELKRFSWEELIMAHSHFEKLVGIEKAQAKRDDGKGFAKSYKSRVYSHR